MKDFKPHIQNAIIFLKKPAVLILLGLMGLSGLLGMGVAILDYQTNFIATRLGKLLVATNALRPQVGNIWQRIEAQTRTRETIDENETLSIQDIQKGLPDPIRKNRFESDVIPDTGIPGYVSIWRTPVNISINDRSLNDIIISRRTYQRGLDVIKALSLPDVHFHNQVQSRVEQIYGQFDAINNMLTDSFLVVEGDTLNSLAPDSLKAAVFHELAIEMIPALKKTEKDALIHTYQDGRIIQIFLYRELGRYRGEVYRETEPTTPIPFTVTTEDMARIFQFALPDTTQVLTTDP